MAEPSEIEEESTFRGSSRFAIVRRLGAGGMGVVYEVLDRDRDVRVALKTLKRFTPDEVQRFKHEFRSLQDIQHPNLVTLGELFLESGQWFFTMELVEGTDFLAYVRASPSRSSSPEDTLSTARELPGQQRARTSTPAPADDGWTFDEHRLRAAMSQLTAGVMALHGAGMVHRDIKPSNIRVTPTGRVALLDFGLVTDVAQDDASMASGIVGSTSYMAPEQALGLKVGPEADWYSVGVILYRALTGRLPYLGSAMQVLMDKQTIEPIPPAALAHDLPKDLEALCTQLLAFEPAQRPTGADVRRVLDGKEVSIAPAANTNNAAVFVGRVQERQILSAALAQTRLGKAASVTIRGPSGVGKSALMREFAEGVAATTPSAIVLAGRCHERESVPYKALDGAMAALERMLRHLDATDAALLVGPDAALIARLFPVLMRVPAVARAASMPTMESLNALEMRHRAFAALRALFERLGAR
ncbi:MAG: serine/threonine-protein kinase, partial [Polyangiales bacterium]